MANERLDYRSYVLRLWRIGATAPTWCASLESTRTGERLGFASLTALLQFLEAETGTAYSPPSKTEDEAQGDE